LRQRNGSVESAVHILCGIFILIGLLALAAAHPALAVVIGGALYALWRTC
jgi:uncharacterized membrane protein YphA (DoxX/SURF4 family)